MNIISRKELFGRVFKDSKAKYSTNSSLEEFVTPLTRLQVLHLLRRTTFGTSIELVDKYVGKTADFIVNELFLNSEKSINPSPPFFFGEKLKNPNSLNGSEKDVAIDRKYKHEKDYNYELAKWWIDLMRKDSSTIVEKMVLFWHNHFTSQFDICNNIPATSMYLQNNLFRKNFAGNFRTLLEQITVDGAMLRYLNGNENISASPNENYAREFLELFTLGVGNYSEQDIKEAAKILTGWDVTMFYEEQTPYVAYLKLGHFDTNNKLFFGEIFSVNYEINASNVFNNSIKKLVDVVLSKKPKVAALFLSKKLYEYFVYSNKEKINKSVIDEMAESIIQNNFEIMPVLKKLLKSQHFYDDLIIGVQIKSPADTIIGMARQFNFDNGYVRYHMDMLGQELLNPPNVAGWKGYRNWISTKTLPSTIYFLKELFGQVPNTTLGEWALNIDNKGDINILLIKVLEIFIARPVSEDRYNKYKNLLLGAAPEYEWLEITKSLEITGTKTRNLIFELIKSPDFYLF